MTEEHIDPIELLKEEMSTDETTSKVNAIHRLPTVIYALGMPATNDKLIPFLDCNIYEFLISFDQKGGR